MPRTRDRPAQPLITGTDGGVELRELGLEMRTRTLLRDLTVTIAPGETLAVMGRSGVGKTTLLRAIAGKVTPTGGTIRRPAGRVAMVFQDPRLMPWRTAIENVEIVMPRGSRRHALEWLDRVGLAEAADVRPGALSGGMRQRVAIARALAATAPVVLVDEPFSHLDEATSDALREELTTHLRAEHHTVIWVTHDAAEAATVGDRTLTMHGPPDGAWVVGRARQPRSLADRHPHSPVHRPPTPTPTPSPPRTGA